MSQGLGMSLDDYIKASKSKGGNNNHSYGNNNGHNNYSGRYKAGGGFNKQQRFKPAGGNYRNRFQRNEEFEENNSGFNKVKYTRNEPFFGLFKFLRKDIGNMIDSKADLRKTRISVVSKKPPNDFHDRLNKIRVLIPETPSGSRICIMLLLIRICM